MNILPLMTNAYVYTERNARLQGFKPVTEPAGVGLTPAEMHGLISGILCGGNSDSSWQPLIHDLTNEGLAFGHELAEALRKMHAATSDSWKTMAFFSALSA